MVSDEDYERVSQWRWCAAWAQCNRSFYAVRNGKLFAGKGGQRPIRMHRFILDAPFGIFVDHKDMDTLNNQRTNLRLCSPKESSRNRRRPSSVASLSIYKGVTFQYGRWKASISTDRKSPQIYLGTFSSEVDAACAYNKAAMIHFGEFARLNAI